MKLSVLMATYAKENPSYLAQAFDSLVCQTEPAGEVILVEDGPLGDPLQAVIEEYGKILPLVRVKLDRCQGVGFALSVGILHCTGDLVARMDSDDLCVPARFETQLRFLREHPCVDVVGGAIAEFDDDSSKIHAIRRLPSGGRELAEFAKLRCPLNHMTVMYRKDKVLQVGSYQTGFGLEDYHLWARMLMSGCQLHNLDEVLVLARCGNGMQGRRGGISYFRREISLVRYMREIGFLSNIEFVRYLLLHAPVRVAPSFIRASLYRAVLRQHG